MFCQQCGCSIPDGAKVCPKCGIALEATKYCKHCGAVIDKECVVCPKCGKQVEELKQDPLQVVINNSNSNTNTSYAWARANSYGYGRLKNKWVALFLCFFLGMFGAHKFYEGKVRLGILYMLTVGLFGIGWIIDLIALLLKPNPYYV